MCLLSKRHSVIQYSTENVTQNKLIQCYTVNLQNYYNAVKLVSIHFTLMLC